MRPFSSLPIRTKLAVVITLLIFGISLFIFIYFPWRLAEQEMRGIRAKARSIAEMSAYGIGPALVFNDLAGAEEVMKSAEQNEDVLYILIVNDSGRVFASFRPERVDWVRFEETRGNEQFSSDGLVYQTVTPVLHNGRPIGEFRLGVSLAVLQEEVSRTRRTIAGVSIIVFLVGMLAVLGISTVITSPLNRMVKSVQNIAAGDFRHRVDVSTRDEVGYLGASVNTMVENLVAAQAELENTNRNLEARVEERTKALQAELNQRIQAEEALYRSQRMLQLVFENIPQRIFWKDRTLRYMGCNDVFARDAGLERAEQVIGKTDYELDWREMADAYRSDDQLVIENNLPKLNFEEPQRTTSGQSLWLRTSKVPLHDSSGQVIGVLGTYEDITERKRAEEQIREQAALLEITRDAIIVVDLNDRILYWNKAAEQVYGWTARDIMNKNPIEVLYRTQGIKEREQARSAVLSRGAWSGELHHVTKSGKDVVVDSRWTLVRTPDGNPQSILIVNTDVTERKQLEIQFHRSQRLELIGTLAGGIAHDLNNVLSPITMAILLLQSKVTDEQGKQWLGTLETSARRGADIVKQVLMFARGIEGDRVALQPKHLLREVEKIAAETFPRSVEVQSQLAGDLWTVSGDTTQLHQVMMNLCVNARDAMPNGGRLLLQAENVVLDEEGARVHVSARPGKYVVLSVSDTGTGIPQALLDKIFDPFFTTKEVGKGTGLGLSTVMAIVKGHRGFVVVDSREGRGTQFSVYLPASETTAQRQQEGGGTRLVRGNGETILLVDDEAPVREITKEILEAYGYTVLLAENGFDALAVYDRNRDSICLVLTDMMMPMMDGAALIAALHNRNPFLKIVAASGLTDIEKITELRFSQAVDAFLSKPFAAEKLLSTLRTILDAKPTTR